MPLGLKVRCSHCEREGWIADIRYQAVCIHCGNVLPPNPRSLLRGVKPTVVNPVVEEPGVSVPVDKMDIDSEPIVSSDEDIVIGDD